MIYVSMYCLYSNVYIWLHWIEYTHMYIYIYTYHCMWSSVSIYYCIIYMSILVEDKTIYHPQWTWPKLVVPYRLWRFVLLAMCKNTVSVYKWVVPCRLCMFLLKFEHRECMFSMYLVLLSTNHLHRTILGQRV